MILGRNRLIVQSCYRSAVSKLSNPAGGEPARQIRPGALFEGLQGWQHVAAVQHFGFWLVDAHHEQEGTGRCR